MYERYFSHLTLDAWLFSAQKGGHLDSYVRCNFHYKIFFWSTHWVVSLYSETPCYGVNVYVSSTFISRSPNPLVWWYYRWGLWEVIRIRWGHEGGVLVWGIGALIRKDTGSLLSVSTCTQERPWEPRQLSTSQEESSHQKPTLLDLDLGLRASRIVRK